MSEKTAALIVAAGSGARFGGAVPKQYALLWGQPVLRRTVEAFLNHPDISSVHVVIHKDHADLYWQATEGMDMPPPVIGAETRQASVLKGLAALRAKKPETVLIHDAARPLVSATLISALCAAAAKSGAAVPTLPVTDTIRRDGKTESRDGLVTVQTPQAFHFPLIDGLHEKYKDKSFTDDAALCEAESHAVTHVPGDAENIKITHAEDLARAETYLAMRCGDVRTGQGYDVHRLVSPTGGRKLMLCGIDVPHDKVLEGHSDADVGLHALTDALLGAIGDGDIGQHFSPKDARWKDADSAAFLRHAANRVALRGGIISHADITLICEAPKIGPHREAMRTRVAEILGLCTSKISVKATTTEGLGFTGRGEGIAAQSVVTVRLPF